jgi:hypothetical protein
MGLVRPSLSNGAHLTQVETMTQDGQATPPVTDWLAESLRSTNFPTPGVEPDARTWWRDLIGQEPETRVVRPAAGEWKEEGPFAGGRLELSVNPAGVIQWTLSPNPLKELPTEFATVGRFVDACDVFTALVRRWYAVAPRLDRIAFGAVVLHPVTDRVEAYRLLSQCLHDVRIDPEGSTDLIYQINRRRPSRSGPKGLEINRLSNWAAIILRVLVQPLVAEARPERSLPALHASRIQLDVNTAPEYRGGFDPSNSAEVFDELVMLAREIVETGDRP